MRNIIIFLLLGLLLAIPLAKEASAQAKSATLDVRCTIPRRLELTSLAAGAEKIEEQSPSRILTQELTTRENQKVFLYTIVEP